MISQELIYRNLQSIAIVKDQMMDFVDFHVHFGPCFTCSPLATMNTES